MEIPRILNALFVYGILLAGLTGVGRAQEPKVRLSGTLTATVTGAREIGPLDPDKEIDFVITFPVRDQAGLDLLLRHLYTRGDPLFRQYLKKGEFAARFGPTQADYDAVIAYAQKAGLRVTAKHDNRLVLDVAGPVAVIEKALDIHLRQFKAADGRLFRRPDAEPAFPAPIAARITGVAALDDSLVPQPTFVVRKQAKAGASPDQIGSGPNAALAPNDITKAYALDQMSDTGKLQSLALFELDGYQASDIQAYEDHFNLTRVNLRNVLLDGVNGAPSLPTTDNPNPGSAEVTLDIQLAIACAPGLSTVIVYEGTNFLDVFNQIANDDAAAQVSVSWVDGPESYAPASFRNTENTVFQQIAAQGQSLYVASGDYGDKVRTGTDANKNPILTFGVYDPPAQPFCTVVGGTTLATNGAGGTYQSETAWSGSGGGISTVWPLPYYQSTVVPAGTNGASTYRNLPDISLDADPETGYAFYYFGGWIVLGGTSCSTPLWAAYTARVNQHRATNGQPVLGFLNPTLYEVAQGPHYRADFHDTTSGNNGTYPAVAGYDNVTGWGSFNGGILFNDLLIDATILHVDAAYTGSVQNGSQTNPYKTLTGAVNAASSTAPTLVYIKGGVYPATISIPKNVTVVNDGGGHVTVGSSTNH